VIIGGGASGVLLAYQLLHREVSDFRVTLVERRPDIGRGLAFHTGNPAHLLNVRAANMSALPDDPDHFWRWISAREAVRPLCPDPYCFVPRRVYGDYIASLIAPLVSLGTSARDLALIHGECVTIREGQHGVTITLADGTEHAGDIAILATGHEAATSHQPGQADPWASVAGLPKDAAVLILGTGLTMADYVLSLLREGHRGPIVAMSRRGLLPKAHQRLAPAQIDEADVPFGASACRLMRWLRDRIERHVEQGGDWRGVIDGVRPFTQRLWQELPLASRRRFLEHARAWWDVHRHRMAPDVEMRLTRAIAEGRLIPMAAKTVAVEPDANGARVRYRRRSRHGIESVRVGAIVDCTGIVRNPGATTNPALRSLFDQGLARADPLGIGIEIGMDCAIIRQDGTRSQRLFAVGPLTRAAFWEITAIPDIRNQCAALAAALIGDGAAAPELQPAQGPAGELEPGRHKMIEGDQDHEQHNA
jgi:uncharacterized NAD(P)/FAD-binding protein YdhS